MVEEPRRRGPVAEAERFDFEHRASHVRVEAGWAELVVSLIEVETYSLGDADDTELLQLLRVEVGEVDPDAAFLVRVDEFREDLQCAGVSQCVRFDLTKRRFRRPGVSFA